MAAGSPSGCAYPALHSHPYPVSVPECQESVQRTAVPPERRSTSKQAFCLFSLLRLCPNIAQIGLKIHPPASASKVLPLQACATMPDPEQALSLSRWTLQCLPTDRAQFLVILRPQTPEHSWEEMTPCHGATRGPQLLPCPPRLARLHSPPHSVPECSPGRTYTNPRPQRVCGWKWENSQPWEEG